MTTREQQGRTGLEGDAKDGVNTEVAPKRLTLKPEEVGPLIGVGRNGVYALINSGRLRSIRLGRKILVPLSAIDDFLSGPMN